MGSLRSLCKRESYSEVSFDYLGLQDYVYRFGYSILDKDQSYFNINNDGIWILVFYKPSSYLRIQIGRTYSYVTAYSWKYTIRSIECSDSTSLNDIKFSISNVLKNFAQQVKNREAV
jgi:hypothetical protein